MTRTFINAAASAVLYLIFSGVCFLAASQQLSFIGVWDAWDTWATLGWAGLAGAAISTAIMACEI